MKISSTKSMPKTVSISSVKEVSPDAHHIGVRIDKSKSGRKRAAKK